MSRAPRTVWVLAALAGCATGGPSTPVEPNQDLANPDASSDTDDSDAAPSDSDAAPSDSDAPEDSDFTAADTGADDSDAFPSDTDPTPPDTGSIDTDPAADSARDTASPDTDAPRDTASADTDTADVWPDTGGLCETPTAHGYETDVPELTWSERVANHCDHAQGYWVCDEEMGSCVDAGVLYDVAVPQPSTVGVYGFYDHSTGALVSRWVGSDTWEFCGHRNKQAWVPVALPGCAPRFVTGGRWIP